jgi:excinuclease UvrABC ATPase subunit
MGVSGSGESSLVSQALTELVASRLGRMAVAFFIYALRADRAR